MSKQSFLGDVVQYIAPTDASARTKLPAIVLAVYPDGSANLRVDYGYCQGSTDLAHVAQTDTATPGAFFYPPANPPQVGDMVNYQVPTYFNLQRAYAAMIVALRGGMVADLLGFNIFTLGTQYLKSIPKAASAIPETYFYPTATPGQPQLGSIINYRAPVALGSYTVPGIITDLNPVNNQATICVLNGFAQGKTDIANVRMSNTFAPGTYFLPKGTKGAGRLHLAVNATTDTALVLETGSDAGAVNDLLQIDDEYLTITTVSSPNNYVVSRAQNNSAIAAHAAGAVVRIGA